VLDSLHQHRWDNTREGPVGPAHLPAPAGKLFHVPDQQAA
jgi:hypothetical protein